MIDPVVVGKEVGNGLETREELIDVVRVIVCSSSGTRIPRDQCHKPSTAEMKLFSWVPSVVLLFFLSLFSWFDEDGSGYRCWLQ